MTKQKYTTIDSTDVDDIREGDRVTYMHEGAPKLGEIRATAWIDHRGKKRAVVHYLEDPSAKILLIERPVVRIAEETGAIYRGGLDGVAVCVDPGDILPWLASWSAANKVADSPEIRWLTTEQVQKLVDEHGYVRQSKDADA